MNCETCLFFEQINLGQGFCLDTQVNVVVSYSCPKYTKKEEINRNYGLMDNYERCKFAAYFVVRLRRCSTKEQLIETGNLIKRFQPKGSLRDSLVVAYKRAKERLNG